MRGGRGDGRRGDAWPESSEVGAPPGGVGEAGLRAEVYERKEHLDTVC